MSQSSLNPMEGRALSLARPCTQQFNGGPRKVAVAGGEGSVAWSRSSRRKRIDIAVHSDKGADEPGPEMGTALVQRR